MYLTRHERILARLVFGIIVILALMLLTIVPARAQGILPASTGCVGDSVVTVFRHDIVGDERGELEAHEAVHRAQLVLAMTQGSMSCYDALTYATSTARINLNIEVPAYQAQADWNHANRSGFNYRDFYLFVAKKLVFAYDSTIPWGEIFTKLYGLDREEPWGQYGEPSSMIYPQVKDGTTVVTP